MQQPLRLLRALKFWPAQLLTCITVCLGSLSFEIALAQNKLVTWGAGGSPILMRSAPNPIDYATPRVVNYFTDVSQADGGFGFQTVGNSLVLLGDGTVWGIGANDYGALGLGHLNPTLTPVPIPGLYGIRQVSYSVEGSVKSSYVLKSDDSIWASGIVNGAVSGLYSFTFEQWSGITDVKSFFGTNLGVMYVKNDSTLWAMGVPNTLTNAFVATPQFGLSGIKAFSANSIRSYFCVKSDGTLWHWGVNDDGQAGNGGPGPEVFVPTQVAGLANIVQIEQGCVHVVALDSNGDVWTWGANDGGQLGLGDYQLRYYPTKVSGLPKIKQISVGDGGSHTLALANDGTVWSWGVNSLGDLGDGTTVTGNVPVRALGISNAVSVKAGYFVSYAIVTPELNKIKSLTINPHGIASGQTATATVTLDHPAEAIGAAVSLETVFGPASVPLGVTVPPGSTSVTFPVTANVVSGYSTALISATAGGNTVYNQLIIVTPDVAAFSVMPTSIIGGFAATGHITLSAAPLVNTDVQVYSSGFAHPSSPATVLAGSTTALINVSTDVVITDQTVDLAAFGSISVKHATLKILASVPVNVTLASSSVVGGNSLTGTVKLNGAVPVNTVVNLSSTIGSAHVNATVTVLAGQYAAPFTIMTDPVTANVMGSISAKLNGVTKSANITLKPETLQSFALNQSSVTGGTLLTGTVKFQNNVAANTTVTIQTSLGAVHVLGSVTVQAPNNSATFVFSTDPVGTTQSGTISASYAGITKQATLTIKASVLSLLTLTPSNVKGGGGNIVSGVVQMSGPVVANTLVMLSNTNTKATLPFPSLVIPAGSSSAIFTMSTAATSVTKTGTVKATVGSVTKSASLTVTP